MEIQALDTSWQNAIDLVQRRLKVPSNLWCLIRNAWSGAISFEEFIRGLGFCAMDLQFLARAAEIGPITNSEQLGIAINRLGLRQSTVAVAVNFACLRGLKRGPQSRSWQNLYADMMERIQIGGRLGSLVHELGTDAGMLAGFSLRAGHLVMMAENPEAFVHLSRVTEKEAFEAKSIELFGCIPSQVGSIVIQQLGFGAAASTGVLLSQLPKSVTSISNSEAELWQAACTWVASLSEFDRLPTDQKWRNYFPSVAGPTPKIQIATILEEVRNARMAKRDPTWHLPTPTYEATDLLVNGWKKSNQYRIVGGRRISVSW